MKTKNIVIILISIVLLIMISLSKDIIAAYLFTSGIKEEDVKVGNVKAVARLFYNENGELTPGKEVILDEKAKLDKKGIYYIDITNKDAAEYIDKVNIKVFIYSDVDTYCRIQIIDQLTVIKDTEDGRKEYAIPQPNPINYHIDNSWVYDKGFYYYPYKVKQISRHKPLELDFILPQSSVSQTYYPDGVFLQLAIRLETVQAVKGPEINWGIKEAPWGGGW